MVLQHWLVAVSDGFCVAHSEEERIVDTGMGHITDHAREQSWHHVEVGQELHETTNFNEVVEVTSDLDNTCHIVVWILRVSWFLNCVYQIQKVAISYGELFEESIRLEQLEAQVHQCILAQCLWVLEDVEVPLVELVHHFD